MSIKKFLFLSLILLTILMSCQNEETNISNPQQDEIIDSNSLTANLMTRTALNDGSTDNIIDYANCLEVVLPVTVTANGVTITIESYTDYNALEALLDAFTNDADQVVITFPITVILSNYTELVINSQQELEAQIENCNGENEYDDDIECIDFQYPISFSIYNTDFQVIETITINNDEALYNFLQSLNGPVLASLNFPVTLVLATGETIEVNSNQELEVAISEAEDDCDEDDDYDYNDDDDCTEAAIELALKECLWEITTYNNTNVFNDYYIDFDSNYGFVVYDLSGNIIHDGTWAISENSVGEFIIEFNTNWQDLNGAWSIENCNDTDEYNLVNIQSTMQIQQVCDANPSSLGCLEANAIVMCDDNNDGVEVFNLYEGLSDINGCTINSPVAVSYHLTIADAETNVNPLSSVTSFTNTINPQVIYVRVEVVNNPSQFEILEIELILEDCSTPCEASDVETYLQTCIWNTVNLDGSDNLIGFDLDFNANHDLAITNTSTNATYSGYWNVSTTATGNILLELANINGPNIQAISGYWDLVDCDTDRLQFTNDNNATFVIEQDCN
ncbi:hypothetical protein LY08_02660 [Olleya aquimaris]|uniref:Uncharacterized protein n=2 Tax=Olleya aquimaris TaxID=639310 RepID=A0A327R6A9_9FLAO|nr:hypothetical protein LY08_02660 [Olleya aquimaris]